MTKRRPLPEAVTEIVVGLATVTLFLTSAAPMASAAPFAYMANQGSTSVSVVDAANPAQPQVVATIPVGVLPADVAVNAAGTRAYVVNFIDETVSVIDTATQKVVDTIPVGPVPNAVAVHPTGTKAYVAHGVGTISVIDLTGPTPSVSIMSGFGNLMGIAVNPAGTRLYVTDANSPHSLGDGSVFSIDLTGASGPVRIPVGNGPMGIAVNSSGTRVYAVGNDAVNETGLLWVINAETNTLETSVGVGDGPVGVAVNPAGTLVYVTSAGDHTVSVVYSRLNRVVEVVKLMEDFTPPAHSPHGIAVDSSGAHVFIGNATGSFSRPAGQVTVMNSALTTVIGHIAVGTGPASFGAFVTNGPAPAGPSGPAGGDTSALQKLLDEANAKIDTLTAQLAAATLSSAALQDAYDKAMVTIARLKDEYQQSSTTIASFILRLMTGRTDENVALAARDAAQQQLALATARMGTRDPRIRHAQKHMNKGMAELHDRRYKRAVQEFAEAYETCWRLHW
jgi:YVTN family beta-propeller protein